MRFCSWQASAEFAFFARLRTARGTTHRQRFLLRDFHAYTMHGCQPTRWSIVTIARSYRRRIISVERVDHQCYRRRLQAYVVAPSLFLGAIPCSTNWLRKQTKFLNHRQLKHERRPIRTAPNLRQRLGSHMSLTPKSLRCPSRHISPTAKSRRWMKFLTSLTRASSCGLISVE